MKRFLKYSVVLLILLSACKQSLQLSHTEHSHYELKSGREDSLTSAIISPYKNKIDAQMNEVIAMCDSTLTKDGYESTLANFVMQAMDHFVAEKSPDYKGKSIAMVNRGGLRINLPKGEISVRTIYELMPFDNNIVMLTISGKALKEALISFGENGKLFSNNIGFYLDKKNPINIQVFGKDWNENENYIIITTDYLANGGDNCFFFENPLKSESTDVKLRDAIIDYCKYLTNLNKRIVPYKNGRITVSK